MTLKSNFHTWLHGHVNLHTPTEKHFKIYIEKKTDRVGERENHTAISYY